MLQKLGSIAYGKCVLNINFDVNANLQEGYVSYVSVSLQTLSYYCKPGFNFDNSDHSNPRCRKDCSYDKTHLTGNLQ
jgi:hypothetical protein